MFEAAIKTALNREMILPYQAEQLLTGDLSILNYKSSKISVQVTNFEHKKKFNLQKVLVNELNAFVKNESSKS
jgi:hypothetical protein